MKNFNHKEKIQNILAQQGLTIVNYYALDKNHNIFELTNDRFFLYYSLWATASTAALNARIDIDDILTKEQILQRIKFSTNIGSSWGRLHLEFIKRLGIVRIII